jgi:Domain of unknown function (DUF4280)
MTKKLVLMGALLECDQAIPTGPAKLSVLPVNLTQGESQSAATVQDFAPMVNIPTLGMCKTQSNPQVAAATAAAMGTLTPQPCIPVPTGPWSPGSSKVTIKDLAALTDDSKCACAWGGNITVQDAGSTKESIGA